MEDPFESFGGLDFPPLGASVGGGGCLPALGSSWNLRAELPETQPKQRKVRSGQDKRTVGSDTAAHPVCRDTLACSTSSPFMVLAQRQHAAENGLPPLTPSAPNADGSHTARSCLRTCTEGVYGSPNSCHVPVVPPRTFRPPCPAPSVE